VDSLKADTEVRKCFLSIVYLIAAPLIAYAFSSYNQVLRKEKKEVSGQSQSHLMAAASLDAKLRAFEVENNSVRAVCCAV
jgi:hypothetical protein